MAVLRLLVVWVIGGPLLLIAGGYAVAHWHAIAMAAGVIVAVLVVIEGVRQQRAFNRLRPTFDPDAAARRAFAVDRDAVPTCAPPGGDGPPRPPRRPASRWRASDFDDLPRR